MSIKVVLMSVKTCCIVFDKECTDASVTLAVIMLVKAVLMSVKVVLMSVNIVLMPVKAVRISETNLRCMAASLGLLGSAVLSSLESVAFASARTKVHDFRDTLCSLENSTCFMSMSSAVLFIFFAE